MSLAVLTRPAGRNEALAQRLAGLGVACLCLPALTLAPKAGAARGWMAAEHYDLVVFVSGYAAACYLQCWHQAGAPLRWPPGTLAATVGAASAQPLFEAGWVAPANIVHPPSDAPQDSESLWRALQARRAAPRRALIVGAGSGRDWLGRQLAAQGCAVQRYAVYERQPSIWTAQQTAPLRAALQTGEPAAVLLTSAQGVDAFDANLRALELTGLYEHAGFAVIHERVASRLQWQAQRAGAGAPRITVCAPDEPAIATALAHIFP